MAEVFDTDLDLQGHRLENPHAPTAPTDVARLIDVTDAVDAAIAAASPPVDGAAGVASLRTLGTGATQAAAGNDARLSLKSYVSSDDSTADYLEQKLIEGANISITKVNAGGVKTLVFAVDGNLGIGVTTDTIKRIVPAAARDDNDSTVPKIVGAFSFNPAEYAIGGTTLSILFSAVAAAGNGTVTGRVKLRNVTDSVDVATLAFTGSTATQKVDSSALAVPADIPNSAKMYEVQIYVDSHSAGSDLIVLYGAQLVVTNTVT